MGGGASTAEFTQLDYESLKTKGLEFSLAYKAIQIIIEKKQQKTTTTGEKKFRNGNKNEYSHSILSEKITRHF